MGRKRKTRWRRLSIGEISGNEEEGEDIAGTVGPLTRSLSSSQNHSPAHKSLNHNNNNNSTIMTKGNSSTSLHNSSTTSLSNGGSGFVNGGGGGGGGDHSGSPNKNSNTSTLTNGEKNNGDTNSSGSNSSGPSSTTGGTHLHGTSGTTSNGGGGSYGATNGYNGGGNYHNQHNSHYDSPSSHYDRYHYHKDNYRPPSYYGNYERSERGGYHGGGHHHKDYHGGGYQGYHNNYSYRNGYNNYRNSNYNNGSNNGTGGGGGGGGGGSSSNGSNGSGGTSGSSGSEGYNNGGGTGSDYHYSHPPSRSYGPGRFRRSRSYPASNYYYANGSSQGSSGAGNNCDNTNKPSYNQDEYTKITTPRQDVLFKKGYLTQKKPQSSVDSASTTTTPSASTNGTPDTQSTNGINSDYSEGYENGETDCGVIPYDDAYYYGPPPEAVFTDPNTGQVYYGHCSSNGEYYDAYPVSPMYPVAGYPTVYYPVPYPIDWNGVPAPMYPTVVAVPPPLPPQPHQVEEIFDNLSLQDASCGSDNGTTKQSSTSRTSESPSETDSSSSSEQTTTASTVPTNSSSGDGKSKSKTTKSVSTSSSSSEKVKQSTGGSGSNVEKSNSNNTRDKDNNNLSKSQKKESPDRNLSGNGSSGGGKNKQETNCQPNNKIHHQSKKDSSSSSTMSSASSTTSSAPVSPPGGTGSTVPSPNTSSSSSSATTTTSTNNVTYASTTAANIHPQVQHTGAIITTSVPIPLSHQPQPPPTLHMHNSMNHHGAQGQPLQQHFSHNQQQTVSPRYHHGMPPMAHHGHPPPPNGYHGGPPPAHLQHHHQAVAAPPHPMALGGPPPSGPPPPYHMYPPHPSHPGFIYGPPVYNGVVVPIAPVAASTAASASSSEIDTVSSSSPSSSSRKKRKKRRREKDKEGQDDDDDDDDEGQLTDEGSTSDEPMLIKDSPALDLNKKSEQKEKEIINEATTTITGRRTIEKTTKTEKIHTHAGESSCENPIETESVTLNDTLITDTNTIPSVAADSVSVSGSSSSEITCMQTEKKVIAESVEGVEQSNNIRKKTSSSSSSSSLVSELEEVEESQSREISSLDSSPSKTKEAKRKDILVKESESTPSTSTTTNSNSPNTTTTTTTTCNNKANNSKSKKSKSKGKTLKDENMKEKRSKKSHKAASQSLRKEDEDKKKPKETMEMTLTPDGDDEEGINTALTENKNSNEESGCNPDTSSTTTTNNDDNAETTADAEAAIAQLPISSSSSLKSSKSQNSQPTPNTKDNKKPSDLTLEYLKSNEDTESILNLQKSPCTEPSSPDSLNTNQSMAGSEVAARENLSVSESELLIMNRTTSLDEVEEDLPEEELEEGQCTITAANNVSGFTTSHLPSFDSICTEEDSRGLVNPFSTNMEHLSSSMQQPSASTHEPLFSSYQCQTVNEVSLDQEQSETKAVVSCETMKTDPSVHDFTLATVSSLSLVEVEKGEGPEEPDPLVVVLKGQEVSSTLEQIQQLSHPDMKPSSSSLSSPVENADLVEEQEKQGHCVVINSVVVQESESQTINVMLEEEEACTSPESQSSRTEREQPVTDSVSLQEEEEQVFNLKGESKNETLTEEKVTEEKERPKSITLAVSEWLKTQGDDALTPINLPTCSMSSSMLDDVEGDAEDDSDEYEYDDEDPQDEGNGQNSKNAICNHWVVPSNKFHRSMNLGQDGNYNPMVALLPSSFAQQQSIQTHVSHQNQKQQIHQKQSFPHTFSPSSSSSTEVLKTNNSSSTGVVDDTPRSTNLNSNSNNNYDSGYELSSPESSNGTGSERPTKEKRSRKSEERDYQKVQSKDKSQTQFNHPNNKRSIIQTTATEIDTKRPQQLPTTADISTSLISSATSTMGQSLPNASLDDKDHAEICDPQKFTKYYQFGVVFDTEDHGIETDKEGSSLDDDGDGGTEELTLKEKNIEKRFTINETASSHHSHHNHKDFLSYKLMGDGNNTTTADNEGKRNITIVNVEPKSSSQNQIGKGREVILRGFCDETEYEEMGTYGVSSSSKEGKDNDHLSSISSSSSGGSSSSNHLYLNPMSLAKELVESSTMNGDSLSDSWDVDSEPLPSYEPPSPVEIPLYNHLTPQAKVIRRKLHAIGDPVPSGICCSIQ